MTHVIAAYFTAYALLALRRRSVAALLAAMLAVSALAGLLVGRTPPTETLRDVANIAYTLLVLTIFILPFHRFRRLRAVIDAHPVRLTHVTAVLLAVGTLAFAINGYVFYRTASYGFESFSEFKNTELGTEFRYSLPISHSLITLASLVSPVAYLLLGLGFYYAHVRRRWHSVACFLLSLNMPLQGFTMYSRSWPVMYVCLVVAYFAYSLPLYSRRVRRRLFIGAAVLMVPVGIYLVGVTANRFADLEITRDSVVQDRQLYYTLDYLSQWNENGIVVMSRFYSWDAIQYGGGTNTLVPFLYNLTLRFVSGVQPEVENELQMRARIWPDPYPASFNGLVANLVFDFGYALALLFAVIYAIASERVAPRRGRVFVSAYLAFGLAVTVPMLSMFGNYFAVPYYNLGIVYAVLVWYYMSARVGPLGVPQAPGRARRSAGAAWVADGDGAGEHARGGP